MNRVPTLAGVLKVIDWLPIIDLAKISTNVLLRTFVELTKLASTLEVDTTVMPSCVHPITSVIRIIATGANECR